MPTKTKNVPQPWLLGAEATLREREGVCLISLLTDEAGAQLIAAGIVPAYVQHQAEDALAWCATDARGSVEAIAGARKARLE